MSTETGARAARVGHIIARIKPCPDAFPDPAGVGISAPIAQFYRAALAPPTPDGLAGAGCRSKYKFLSDPAPKPPHSARECQTAALILGASSRSIFGRLAPPPPPPPQARVHAAIGCAAPSHTRSVTDSATAAAHAPFPALADALVSHTGSERPSAAVHGRRPGIVPPPDLAAAPRRLSSRCR